MSAFICSDNHINTLATWAAYAEVSYQYFYDGEWRNIKKDPAKVAEILYKTNADSVNANYGKDEVIAGIKYKRGAVTLAPVQILKLCDCYDYQASEVDEYENTIACKIIAAIRAAAIRKLPGYDVAPWAI